MLCPVDLSAFSEGALRQATATAAWFRRRDRAVATGHRCQGTSVLRGRCPSRTRGTADGRRPCLRSGAGGRLRRAPCRSAAHRPGIRSGSGGSGRTWSQRRRSNIVRVDRAAPRAGGALPGADGQSVAPTSHSCAPAATVENPADRLHFILKATLQTEMPPIADVVSSLRNTSQSTPDSRDRSLPLFVSEGGCVRAGDAGSIRRLLQRAALL